MTPYSSTLVFHVYGAGAPGDLYSDLLNETHTVRPVLSLNSTTLLSGNGTVDDPFVIVP